MSKKNSLKQKYGIDIDNYNELRKLQKFRCKLCKLPEKLLNEELVVDHDHKTGEIRGLLCRRCNVGLGMFQDSPKRLIKAALYLTKRKNLTDTKYFIDNVVAFSIKDMAKYREVKKVIS